MWKPSPPEPQNVTVFGDGAFTEVIRVKSSGTGVLVRRGEDTDTQSGTLQGHR